MTCSIKIQGTLAIMPRIAMMAGTLATMNRPNKRAPSRRYERLPLSGVAAVAPSRKVILCFARILLARPGSGVAPRQQVCATRIDLTRVAYSLQPHLDMEARTFNSTDDLRWLVETEIDIHGMPPPLVQVPYLRANMKGVQEKPAGPQYPVDLAECPVQFPSLQMNDRVERNG